MQEERRYRSSKLGSAVEPLLTYEPTLIREEWIRIQGWYKDAAERPPSLAHISLETLTAEHVELYSHVPPPGRPISIKVAPFPLDDTILEEDYFVEAVTWLRLHRAKGPSVIRAKNLRMWHCTTKREDNPEPGN